MVLLLAVAVGQLYHDRLLADIDDLALVGPVFGDDDGGSDGHSGLQGCDAGGG